MQWADRWRRGLGGGAEVGYPADVVGEDFVGIVRINFLGSRDGSHPPARPLLENALEVVRGRGDLRLLQVEDLEAEWMRLARLVEDEVRRMLASGEGLVDNAQSTIGQKGVNAPLRTPGGADRFEALLTVRPLPR